MGACRELARLSNQTLLSRRKDSPAGLGRSACRKRPLRLELLSRLEVWQPGGQKTLAQSLLPRRVDIAREFAHLIRFDAGLTTGLPAWVRCWVGGQLLINACRRLVIRQKKMPYTVLKDDGSPTPEYEVSRQQVSRQHWSPFRCIQGGWKEGAEQGLGVPSPHGPCSCKG